jgi:hypothetical protein
VARMLEKKKKKKKEKAVAVAAENENKNENDNNENDKILRETYEVQYFSSYDHDAIIIIVKMHKLTLNGTMHQYPKLNGTSLLNEFISLIQKYCHAIAKIKNKND